MSYDCRKKVADGRLRIKGKVVTREQICEQLGVNEVEGMTPNELKELLERKSNLKEGESIEESEIKE